MNSKTDTRTTVQRAELIDYFAKVRLNDFHNAVVDQTLIDRLIACRDLLTARPAEHLFVDELIRFTGHSDPAALEQVLPSALSICDDLLKQQCEFKDYFWLLNDLHVLRGKTPVSELVFAIPAEFSAATGDELVSILPGISTQTTGTSFESRFENQLQTTLSAQSDNGELQALATLCRESIDASTHEYATVFWLTCSSYFSSLTQAALMTSAAHHRVLQQIELVIQQHVRDADSPILDSEGIALAEKNLCSMLSYLACVQPADRLVDRLERRFQMRQSVLFAESDPSTAGTDTMLGAGIAALCRKIARLKLDIDAAPHAQHTGITQLLVSLQEIRDVCALLFGKSLVNELDGAAAGLKNYLTGAGALSDLERCVAVLIHAEQTIGGLSADTQARPDESDEPDLDAHIVAEMIAMLAPLAADADESGINQEWLTVVLTDISSLSTFQGDQFLEHNLALVKTRLTAQDTSAELLQRFAQSLSEYLQALHTGNPIGKQKQAVTAAVSQLKVLPPRVEPAVSIAELANDHRALLQPVGASAEPVTPGHGSATQKDDAILQPLSSLEFGEQCNRYIDTIQLALDTALGSSGNLAPDKTVVTALENLRQVVSSEHNALLQLIEPLSDVLSSAEQAGSLLSQSDTLLIQEAIVAITIGVDAVANEQPMPELVADVAQRITELAVDETHQSRGGFEAAGLVDIFVEEGDDLAQRLFELFQRWRAAPHGGTRIQGDIKRLLHTLKGSADTVGLNQIAQLAHALETYIAGADGAGAVDVAFFEVATEAIEVILDDIDRIRNRESTVDRSDTIVQLSGQLDLSARVPD
ncbi:MAG: Hpt domain-containing protein, partial [Pseudomonadota bacterium]